MLGGKTKNDEIGARLKKARKDAGLTQVDVAKALGVTFGAVSQWAYSQTSPKGRNLIALAKLYKVGPAWLSHGEGERQATNESGELYWISSFDTWDEGTALGEDEVELPLFKEVELGCGTGRYTVEEAQGPKLRFSKASLRRANVDPAAAACAFVVGDSMEPTLPDGACVGIDTASKSVRDGEMYCVNYGGLLRVKKLYRLPGGGLRIHSANPAYPDEMVTPEQMQDSFNVIGRVFWYSVLV
jgi:phage repressor protein C with HTH and peptisase S24 domain